MSLEQEIEEKLNNVSLLLVMVSSDDRTGLEAVDSFLDQVIDLLLGKKEYVRAQTSLKMAKEFFADPDQGADYIAFVEKLIAALQRFLQNPTSNVRFPHEDESICNQDFEFASHFDSDFLGEFMEKHLLLLEDLEGQVTEYHFKEVQLSEDEKAKFEKYVRSYLHNIKGDAGAIGVAGIETATHTLEDLLQGRKAGELLSALTLYREWATKCIKSYAKSQPPREHSRSFIKRLRKIIDESDLQALGRLEESMKSAKSEPASIADRAKVEVPKNEPAAPQSVAPVAPAVSKSKDADLGEYRLLADNTLFAEFAAEADDHLKELERIMLERSENLQEEDIGTIFRCVHSLKGASSFFNLLEINEVSHVLETILDEVRNGKRVLDNVLANLVLEYVDLQTKLIATARVSAESSTPIKRIREAADYLGRLKEIATHSGSNVASAPSSPAQVAQTTAVSQVTKQDVEHPHEEVVVASVKKEVSEDEAKFKVKQAKGETTELKTFIKIDTGRLDQLIDSIGEMVIYSSMLIRKCRELLSTNETIQQTTHQVEKFSRDLQEIGMSMRLDPIKGLFQKMARLVWDVSKRLGKDINFIMKGEDTELDRTVIERLADPLMHMVRNAMDHGIEPPAERASKGKNPKGTIELRAYHAGGSIHVQVSDDGRGLDKQKLKAKAIEKGLITPDQILTDQETFQLIFAPGFSTAAVVTDISGRGVGMDVVRNNIENMRGQVFIESELGKGSTFLIELPLTLAIIEGIETTVGLERFIIPTLSIIELIRPTPDMLCSTVGENDTFKFRERFMPLYKLAKLYGIDGAKLNPTDAIVAIVESGNEQIGLLVDDIVGSCQTVIKSLGGMFKEGQGLAGCAIMSNGDIGLILDVRSIIQLSRTSYQFEQKLDSAAMRDSVFSWHNTDGKALDAASTIEI